MGHIAERSGCRCVLELEHVPLAAGVREAAPRVGLDPFERACGFGEEGRCEAGSGVEPRLGERTVEPTGWDHFG